MHWKWHTWLSRAERSDDEEFTGVTLWVLWVSISREESIDEGDHAWCGCQTRRRDDLLHDKQSIHSLITVQDVTRPSLTKESLQSVFLSLSLRWSIDIIWVHFLFSFFEDDWEVILSLDDDTEITGRINVDFSILTRQGLLQVWHLTCKIIVLLSLKWAWSVLLLLLRRDWSFSYTSSFDKPYILWINDVCGRSGYNDVLDEKESFEKQWCRVSLMTSSSSQSMSSSLDLLTRLFVDLEAEWLRSLVCLVLSLLRSNFFLLVLLRYVKVCSKVRWSCLWERKREREAWVHSIHFPWKCTSRRRRWWSRLITSFKGTRDSR